MLGQAAIDRLRDDLIGAGYSLDAVTDRLGEAGLAGLSRNSGVAADRALEAADDPQAAAIRLWLLQQPVPIGQLRWLDVPGLREAGLVDGGTGDLRATVELKPYGSQERQGWICSDQTPLDTRIVRPRPDFVLGASPASTTLAQLVPRRRVGTALDLGTGCGIQTVHLADHADRVVATDLNPRALDLARITLGLNQIEAELRLGSLYEPVAGQGFDLVVTNPPYVMSPPGGELVYREGGFEADHLMREVVRSAPLNPDGLLVVLGNWAMTEHQSWQERVAEWVPAGHDALVLQREALDPFEYIEVWLADAGLSGSSDYLPGYRAWLEYFRRQRITGVGMGWIFVRNAGGAEPDVRLEEWPHAVHQPVADAVLAHFAGTGPARWTDEGLLAATLRRSDGLVQETVGGPGAADPEHIVLRQQAGFGRAVVADTALAAVVGACDGDLPLGVLVDAVAGLLDVDGSALAPEILGQVRPLLADGLLIVGGGQHP
ncbi:MAG: methyltransferase [Propionibacteriaceae bacterium]|nr:methyltransferase [Propionibacteriaceae bacterium]